MKKIFLSNYIINIDKINFRLRDRVNYKNRIFLKQIKKIFEFPKILSFIDDKKLKNKIIKEYSNELDDYNSFTYIELK